MSAPTPTTAPPTASEAELMRDLLADVIDIMTRHREDGATCQTTVVPMGDGTTYENVVNYS